MKFLKGKKTYTAAAALVLTAAAGYLNGDLTATAAVVTVLQGAAAAALRSGMKAT